MLSHEDERRLNAIERQMLSDDPDFVRRFRRGATSSMPASTDRPVRGPFGTAVLAVLSGLSLLGALILLAGLLVASVGLILCGGSLAAVTTWGFRRLRRRWPGY